VQRAQTATYMTRVIAFYESTTEVPSSNNGTALLHYGKVIEAYNGPRQLHPGLSAEIVLQR